MSKGVELTEKELKEVVGGVCIADGYLYYSVDGINYKAKINSHEKELREVIDYCNTQGFSDREIINRLYGFEVMTYLGPGEEC